MIRGVIGAPKKLFLSVKAPHALFFSQFTLLNALFWSAVNHIPDDLYGIKLKHMIEVRIFHSINLANYF